MTITEGIGIVLGFTPFVVGGFRAYGSLLTKIALLEAKLDKLFLKMKGDFDNHVIECNYERKNNLERYQICKAEIKELDTKINKGD